MNYLTNTPDQHLKDLKKMLPDAKKRAKAVKELKESEGFLLFEDWVRSQDKGTMPAFQNKDQIAAYNANNLVVQGIKTALAWFEQAEQDFAEIKSVIKELEQEIAKDVDDDDDDL